jgi:hypothetical protein
MKAKAEYFGIKFYELAKFPFPVRFTIGYDDEKGEHHLMGDGILTVDKTEGSYAYGPELQIHLRFTGKVKEKLERAFNNGHDRIEICMAESEGINFFYNALMGFQNLPKPQDNTASKPRRAMEKVADFV